VKLTAGASDAMKLPNWQLPGQWRLKVGELREQLDAARAALHETITNATTGEGSGESV
jgi:hypothetical protein